MGACTVDVEQKPERPENGALGNSTCHFRSTPTLYTAHNADVQLFSFDMELQNDQNILWKNNSMKKILKNTN